MYSGGSDRLSPVFDPWEPEGSRRGGAHRLTSIELTVSHRCNMRCRHCAVGEILAAANPEPIGLPALLARLEEVPSLQTLSITGGEPSEDLRHLREYILPVLRYARDRGLKTQINTNLTFDLARYDLIAPYVDVFHITWNYADVQDFHRIAWGHGREQVSAKASAVLFERIVANAAALSRAGSFLSAESMVNRETAPHLGRMNRAIAAMGCRRHEIHPMYPVDWAAGLPVLTLDEYRLAVERLLEQRDPDLWVLFGTFPFLPCSPDPRDRALRQRVKSTAHCSIRNCPDGRNRINVNVFTGECYVTDFAPVPSLGNLRADSLAAVFARWQGHPAFAPFNCYCPEAGCTGPNLIVADVYHPGVDFRSRRAIMPPVAPA